MNCIESIFYTIDLPAGIKTHCLIKIGCNLAEIVENILLNYLLFFPNLI